MAYNEFSLLENAIDKFHNLYFKEKQTDTQFHISSGFKEIDDITGICGYPKGGIVEIYGRESTGKTYIVLSAIEEAQKNGSVLFVNSDYTFIENYFSSFNIDKDLIHIISPGDGDDIYQSFEYILRSGAISLVIVDSIASILPPKGGDPIEHIKYISVLIKKLSAAIGQYNIPCLFTNHIREGSSKRGVSTGGNILKFYSRIRLNTEKTGKFIYNGDEIIGETIKITVVKNKLNKHKENKSTKIDILYK